MRRVLERYREIYALVTSLTRKQDSKPDGPPGENQRSRVATTSPGHAMRGRPLISGRETAGHVSAGAGRASHGARWYRPSARLRAPCMTKATAPASIGRQAAAIGQPFSLRSPFTLSALVRAGGFVRLGHQNSSRPRSRFQLAAAWGAQPGEGYVDEALDGSPGWQAAGGGEGVQAVAGRLIRWHVVADLAGSCRVG